MKSKIINGLIENKIYNVDLNKKIKFASGIESNIYCDNRKILNFPRLYKKIVKALSKQVKRNGVDVVLGTATAGIPWAILVGNKLNKPCGYVRLKSKDHGTKKMVEGANLQNQRVVLIEDLITTGESVLKAANTVLAEGAKSVDIISIFSYDFGIAKKNFKNAKLSYEPLIHFQELIEYYKSTNKDIYNKLMTWWKKHK